ncbi:MAG: autotransporter domain-containing protein [Pseudomonadota bacterium]
MRKNGYLERRLSASSSASVTRSDWIGANALGAGYTAFSLKPLSNVLLGTVAAAALLLMAPAMAQAQAPVTCAADPTSNSTLTCTGDLSRGVEASNLLPEETVVNVNNPATDITPADDLDGIKVTKINDGGITVNVDLGDKTIIPWPANNSGRTGDGIFAAEDGDGTLTINFTGNVDTDSDGIEAVETQNGDLNVRFTAGRIDTLGSGPDVGIRATESGAGDVTVVLAAPAELIGNGEGISVVEKGDGDVVIDVRGRIEVRGANGAGISASQADDGQINVTSSGDVKASGADADGIRTENTSAGGATTVNVLGGSIHGGSGDGAGINFSLSGTDTENTLQVATGAKVSAESGIAVRGGDGDESVHNAGKLIGSVNLGAGADTFRLFSTADLSETKLVDGGGDSDVFNVDGTGSITVDGDQHANFEILAMTGTGTLLLTGDHTFSTSALINRGTLNLASGSNLASNTVRNNAATLGIGETAGGIGSATIAGNYIQTRAGTYAVDVNLETETADHLTVSGNATLNGFVNVNIVAYASGKTSVTILTADGSANVDDNLKVQHVPIGGQVVNVQLHDIEVTTTGSNDVVLSFSVDPDLVNPIDGRLNPNQRRIAQAIDDIDAGGTGALDPVVSALITGPTNIDAYRNALDVLLPEVYLNTDTAMLFSAHDFMGDMFSCPTSGDGRAVARDGQCLWVRPKGRKFDRDATFENIGYEDTVGGVSAGTQFKFAPGWFVNVAAGYESGSLSTDSGAESDSDRYHIGGAVKYEMGPWQFAAAAAAGIGSFDTSRRIAFSGFNDGTATSEHDVHYIGGQFRASYHLVMPGWYARPQVDVTVTHVDREDVTESGAATANLTVDGGEETIFAVTPGVEIGGTYELVPGTTLKPFLIAGVTFFSDDEHSATSAFALAPDVTFATNTEHGDVFGNIHAGTTLVGDTSNFNLTLGYKGTFSDDVTQHGVYARGAWAF